MANTIKMTALRPFFGIYGKVRKGDEVEIGEHHAKKYQDKGLAVPSNFKMATAAPENKMGSVPSNKAAARPLPSPSRSGGQTGAAKRSSSSQAVPAQKTVQSKKREEDQD